MNYKRLSAIGVASVLCLAVFAPDASAQRRGGRPGGGGGYVGRAAPRPSIGGGRTVVSPRRYITPRVYGIAPYRPYYYPYRPGLTIGFYAGLGYPYRYGYPYPYYGYGSYG